MGWHKHLTVALLVLPIGCSSGATTPPHTNAPNVDESVTFEQYQAGFAAYVDCLQAAGFTAESIALNDETKLYEAQIPGGAVDSGVDDRCYQGTFRPANEGWQSNPTRPRAANDPGSAADVMRLCLQSVGVADVPKDASNTDLAALLSENGVSLERCLEIISNPDPPAIAETSS